MSTPAKNGGSEWYCVNCSHVLGRIVGGELVPAVDGKNIITSGPNLNITCPKCGAVKVFYTSDPVVRAVYQLVHAISDVAARSMIAQLGKAVHDADKK